MPGGTHAAGDALGEIDGARHPFDGFSRCAEPPGSGPGRLGQGRVVEGAGHCRAQAGLAVGPGQGIRDSVGFERRGVVPGIDAERVRIRTSYTT